MIDITTYARFALALIFVLGLILVIAWGMRRFGIGARLAPNTPGRRRLQVVEVAPLDARHKLVMVRRDEIEHVLLIGQGDPVVVERGIGAASGRRSFARQLEAETSE
jgi:flagellar protein FliO/FliZ